MTSVPDVGPGKSPHYRNDDKYAICCLDTCEFPNMAMEFNIRQLLNRISVQRQSEM